MYNLIVSGNPDSWDGESFLLDRFRCVREYTDDEITQRLGDLSSRSIEELLKFPTVFAYETAQHKNPKFGLLTEITPRNESVRLAYKIVDVQPFLTYEAFDRLTFELDIRKWEMNRTHWAVKNVNLAQELSRNEIRLPSWSAGKRDVIDLGTHQFKVALSFPGTSREKVEAIAVELERALGPNTYFYDDNYTAQLARPSLDLLLQDIYRRRSQLIVVFLSSDYQGKMWCGLEFRAIRDLIATREVNRIMYVRLDGGDVEGVFNTDGYIDADRFSPNRIAEFIVERVQVLQSSNR